MLNETLDLLTKRLLPKENQKRLSLRTKNRINTAIKSVKRITL